ncbi:TPA: ead/Ea22-like family protein [Citrobacter koseri]
MTIDKQALREAAEKALPAMQRLLMMPNDELFDEALLNVDGDVDAANAFNLLSGPETVLALLDELESKQTFQQAFFRQSLMYDVVAEAYEEAKEQIAKDVEIKARLCRESNSLFDRLRAAEKRIAELEARAVTLPTPYPKGYGLAADKYNFALEECADAIRAAGVAVDGDL